MDRPALESYARVFNAVEGNTTFYSVPDERSVSAWRAAVDGCEFRFSFKLPRSVTHEARPSFADLRLLFKRLEPLGDYLGPFLVQLPASVGPDRLDDLERLLERLPRRYRYVLEVRHPAFFGEPGLLEPLIDEFRLGRVMLDSRPIYRGDRSHPDVRDALHEKPDLPVIDTVCNGLVFVRLILHPDIDSNEAWIHEWADRSTRYLEAGHRLFMMIHCPNNQHCPALARTFHARLRDRRGTAAIGELPPWPVPTQASLL